MPIYLLLRIASVLVVVLIAAYSPNSKTWLSFVYSYTFAHFAIALVYSKRQFAEVFKQPDSLLPLFSIVVLGTAFYFGQVSLLFYFSLHHAFNEAFVIGHTLPADKSDVKALRGSTVLVHLFLYFLILRRQAGFSFAPTNPLYALAIGMTGGNRYLLLSLAIGGLAISYAIFFYYLFRVRRGLNLRTLIESCGFELFGLIILAVSVKVNVSYLHVVLYHVVFWSLYPIPKIWAQGPQPLARYLLLTVAAVAGFLLVSPVGIPPFQSSTRVFNQQFFLWTHIHITSSFLLSNAHPEWLVNLFRPKPVPAFAKG